MSLCIGTQRFFWVASSADSGALLELVFVILISKGFYRLAF